MDFPVPHGMSSPGAPGTTPRLWPARLWPPRRSASRPTRAACARGPRRLDGTFVCGAARDHGTSSGQLPGWGAHHPRPPNGGRMAASLALGGSRRGVAAPRRADTKNGLVEDDCEGWQKDQIDFAGSRFQLCQIIVSRRVILRRGSPNSLDLSEYLHRLETHHEQRLSQHQHFIVRVAAASLSSRPHARLRSPCSQGGTGWTMGEMEESKFV